jgi:hypothetical protein
MASNLAASTRSFGNDISDPALRKAYVGPIAGFETYKLDYAYRKARPRVRASRSTRRTSITPRKRLRPRDG